MSHAPSPAQQARFLALTGYPYPPNTARGSFSTDRPYNDDQWQYSRWSVDYIFHTDTGHLYCELSHRMTNNRCHGWDARGEDLSYEDISRVYRSHM